MKFIELLNICSKTTCVEAVYGEIVIFDTAELLITKTDGELLSKNVKSLKISGNSDDASMLFVTLEDNENNGVKYGNKPLYGDVYDMFAPICDWLAYHYPSDDARFVVTRAGAMMYINHGPQISNENAWEEAKENLHNILGNLTNRLQNKEAQHAASNEEIERN